MNEKLEEKEHELRTLEARRKREVLNLEKSCATWDGKFVAMSCERDTLQASHCNRSNAAYCDCRGMAVHALTATATLQLPHVVVQWHTAQHSHGVADDCSALRCTALHCTALCTHSAITLTHQCAHCVHTAPAVGKGQSRAQPLRWEHCTKGLYHSIRPVLRDSRAMQSSTEAE
jgi:hypothetical protein